MNTTNVITVATVREYNDCAGRKSIEITSQEYDELIPTRFRMTQRYLPGDLKLRLSSIAPGDQAVIDPTELGSDPVVCGAFVDLLVPHNDRDPVCRCGKKTVSDGWNVYCPDPDCPLSFLARLDRLAGIPFLAPTAPAVYARHYYDEGAFSAVTPYLSEVCGAPELIEQPFRPVLRPEFWGKPGYRLEDIILGRGYGHVSMATFLVEDLLRTFLDHVHPHMPADDPLFQCLGECYGLITDAFQRRREDDPRQDHVIKCFLWSLGIQALSPDIVNKMCLYEKCLGSGDDVLVIYAMLLSHPDELVREFGVHQLEAAAIANEFRRRRYEMVDIFSPHCSSAGLRDAFGLPCR